MKKFVLIGMAMLLALMVQAQDATKILDKSAATLKSAGNVKIGFTIEVEGGSSNGYIKLQGQKFVINMGSTISWFDGKTMWTYVKANDEVNVTEPTANEVAKMNPYSFLSFYKNGYTAKMGTGTAKAYEVVLTSEEGNSFQKVVIRVNKSTYYPTSVRMISAKGAETYIRCNSLLKNQRYKASTFQFKEKDYPGVDVIDLR
ncbi:MAG: outer-membrane lipoprotein carrier protein LolA [Bacteroidaceae bacterium]|nr:outer-membrane lipoprotein carrier protein LolA [Bacteroidaceae bacterium]